MAGGTQVLQNNSNQTINWAEKYIERLAKDMEELRGMEGRLTERIETVNKDLTERIDSVNKELTQRIDTSNKQTQNLVLATIIGIGAMTVAIAVALFR